MWLAKESNSKMAMMTLKGFLLKKVITIKWIFVGNIEEDNTSDYAKVKRENSYS